MNKNTFNPRKGQRKNEKYRNLVGSDQQMQRLLLTNMVGRKTHMHVRARALQRIFCLKSFLKRILQKKTLQDD